MLLDILVILLVVAGVAFGFWKGLVDQGLAILGIYLGALLARFIYEPVARATLGSIGFDLHVAQLLVFLLVLILGPTLLLVGTHWLWGSLRLPGSWGQLDLLGGAALGLVVGVLAAMFAVLAFGYLAVQSTDIAGATHYPLFTQIQLTWNSSVLRAPIVAIGHIAYYCLLPGVGTNIPDILQVFTPR